MINERFNLPNLEGNKVPKYKKVIGAFTDSISSGIYKSGDSIPSINIFSKHYMLSRDTVFKAYTELKDKGYIKATKNKGYYIADNKIKILFLVSTFKAYKEVLYHSFIKNLPNNIIVDVQFHHYNEDNFSALLNIDEGKYYKYVVMGFNSPKVTKALSRIDKNKLLLIDLKVNIKNQNNYVLQNFDKEFYKCLDQALHLFQKYEAVNFIYPEFTYHPKESIASFEEFCTFNNLKYKIIRHSKDLVVERNTAYVSVSDRMLYELLDQCQISNFELGKDVGILSYNDTPIKKFTYKGISVVSIDFKHLGEKAAEFIKSDISMKTYIPTNLIIRDSL